MRKLLAIVTAALFAAVSFNAMAASHAGAPGKDDKKKGSEMTTKDGKKVDKKEDKKK